MYAFFLEYAVYTVSEFLVILLIQYFDIVFFLKISWENLSYTVTDLNITKMVLGASFIQDFKSMETNLLC